MLRIHTGLRKWSKKNILNLHLKKINQFVIHKTCIKIAKNELIFEQYIMAPNRERYDIEVRNDDEIKSNQILFGFMQLMFN